MLEKKKKKRTKIGKDTRKKRGKEENVKETDEER